MGDEHKGGGKSPVNLPVQSVDFFARLDARLASAINQSQSTLELRRSEVDVVRGFTLPYVPKAAP